VAEGVVTRTVRDTAHHIAAMERSYRNRKLPLVGLVEGPHKRRLRIGLARISPSGAPVADETIGHTEATAELLASLGHTVREVSLPSDRHFADDFTLYWAFAAVLMATANKAAHRGRFEGSRLDPFTKGLIAHWRANRGDTVTAIRRLRAARAEYDAMFSKVDVVLSPTLNHPTPLLGHMDPSQPYEVMMRKLTDYVGFTPVNNICGGPGISLPAPLGESGTPGAVQLSAAWGAERTLLELAYELEDARPFPDIRERAGALVG
jgi:amidase